MSIAFDAIEIKWLNGKRVQIIVCGDVPLIDCDRSLIVRGGQQQPLNEPDRSATNYQG